MARDCIRGTGIRGRRACVDCKGSVCLRAGVGTRRVGRPSLTFREETRLVIDRVATEEPSISELVVSLDQNDAVAFGEAQLIGAPRDEVICSKEQSAHGRGSMGDSDGS